jgi:hypothetical protein
MKKWKDILSVALQVGILYCLADKEIMVLWKLETGSWMLEVRNWRLETGDWN